MPRQTFSWSIEKARMARAPQAALSLKWELDTSAKVARFVGYDADSRPRGAVDLIGDDYVARVVLPSFDIARVAAFNRTSGCVALRQAQAAVEAAVLTSAQQVAA